MNATAHLVPPAAFDAREPTGGKPADAGQARHLRAQRRGESAHEDTLAAEPSDAVFRGGDVFGFEDSVQNLVQEALAAAAPGHGLSCNRESFEALGPTSAPGDAG
jgi:hypothetical protein